MNKQKTNKIVPDVIKFLRGKEETTESIRTVKININEILNAKSSVLSSWKRMPPVRSPIPVSSSISLPLLKNPVTKKSEFPGKNFIVEIYSIGYAHRRGTGYGNPIGLGILITNNLVLTTHKVLSDEDLAVKVFAVIPSYIKVTNNFDPKAFFYTNKGLNFTIIGFQVNPSIMNAISTLEVREKFQLTEWSTINYIGAGTCPREMIGIEKNQISYTGGDFIVPGSPIFTTDWKAQGIHHTNSASYTYNQGTRIDSILFILCSVKDVTVHPELDRLLKDYEKPFLGTWRPVKGSFGEGKYLYWMQPKSYNIYRYSIPRDNWELIRIKNKEQFLLQETEEWRFNHNSSLVYLPDRSIIIVGGVDQYVTKADVYHFISKTGYIYRKAKMLEKREGAAIVYRQSYVYVLGGKYTYNTCEKYSLENDQWSYIPPMINGRFQPAACLLKSESYLYVAGGSPVEQVGRRIERFNFEYEIWESLSIRLPVPMHRCGVYPVTQNKIAFLGGSSTRMVCMLEVDDIADEGELVEEDFMFHEIGQMDNELYTDTPVVYFLKKHRVFTLNEMGPDQLPTVDGYNYDKFVSDEQSSMSADQSTPHSEHSSLVDRNFNMNNIL